MSRGFQIGEMRLGQTLYQFLKIRTFANRKIKMFKVVLGFCFWIIAFLSIQAQYLNEVGVFAGGSNYSGDIGNETFIAPNRVAGGIIYRRNLNERLTLRGTLSVYPVSDDDNNSSNPVREQRGIRFTNTLAEVATGLEFNYVEYDITSYENRFTPYLFAEVAAFRYSTIGSIVNEVENYNTNISYAIPFGLGFKGGITRNWGYATELRARYTFVDNIDYNNEKIPVLNVGNPKNNDWYFFVGVGLTYSFGRPPCAVEPRY